MELAVVAPTHALYPVTALKYQWALTSQFDNESYKSFFLRQSDSDKYVILAQDNMIRPFLLAQYADDIGAREIVLPSATNQYYETTQRIQETLMGMVWDREASETLRGLRPHFMLVPQGEDVFVWSNCLKKSLDIYQKVRDQFPRIFPFDPIIGLQSTWLITLDPELELPYIRDVVKHHGKAIHLLGWNTLTTFGIKFRSVSTMVPFIRASGILFGNGNLLTRKFTSGEMDNAALFIKQLKKKV